MLVALVGKIGDKIPLKVPFALIAFGNNPFSGVFFENDEVIGLGDGEIIGHWEPRKGREEDGSEVEGMGKEERSCLLRYLEAALNL